MWRKTTPAAPSALGQSEVDDLRRIALSITETAPFEAHLLWRILAKARPMNRGFAKRITDYEREPARDMIVALREDGLCQRVVAMLYGRLIAASLGLEFKATWPDLTRMEQRFGTGFGLEHSVPAQPQKLFSPDFIRDWMSTEVVLKIPAQHVYQGRMAERGFYLNEVLKYQNRAKIIRPFWLAPAQIKPDMAAQLDLAEARDLFENAMFNQQVAASIRQANAAALPRRPVALHVRSGDIVYGATRLKAAHPARNLSIPLMTAKHLCAKLIAKGHSVLVFGATSGDLAFLSAEFAQVHTVSDLGLEPGPPHEEMLRDIALMARCEKLIAAPATAVAHLAALIANQWFVPLADIVPPAEEYRVLLAALAGDGAKVYPDLQKAFGYYSLFQLAPNDLEADLLQGYLTQALAHDPGNPIYQALVYFSALGQGWQDEAARYEALFGADEGSIEARISHLRPYLNPQVAKTRQTLENAAKACADPQVKSVISGFLKPKGRHFAPQETADL